MMKHVPTIPRSSLVPVTVVLLMDKSADFAAFSSISAPLIVQLNTSSTLSVTSAFELAIALITSAGTLVAPFNSMVAFLPSVSFAISLAMSVQVVSFPSTVGAVVEEPPDDEPPFKMMKISGIRIMFTLRVFPFNRLRQIFAAVFTDFL